MSKIEQIITEIEEYIDNCKFQPLSTTKIVVNKDDIDELLAELRLRTPDEIKKYQKIIANQQQAQDILGNATNEANDLRTRAMQYTDDILANVQSILSTGMDSFEHAQSEMMTSLNSSLNVVVESRKELGGQDEEATDEQTDDDDITVDLL